MTEGATKSSRATERRGGRKEEKQKVIKTKWYLHGKEKKSSDKVSVVLYGFSLSLDRYWNHIHMR